MKYFVFSRKKLFKSIWVACVFCVSVSALGQDFPNYELGSFQYGCPAAADVNSYNDSYLRLLKVLSLGKDDWLFRTSTDLLDTFGPEEAFLPVLKRLSDSFKAKGVQLVVVYPPSRALLHHRFLDDLNARTFNYELALTNYRQALDRIRAQGILVPDYSQLINDARSENYYFKRDNHWTPAGAQVTAQLIADTLKSLNATSNIPMQKFTNRVEGVYGREGIIQMGWKTICDQEFVKQFVPMYLHERVAASDVDEADALFSDDSTPQISLVGTSFSDDLKFNFVGFLREYLNADVSNLAVRGGGLDGAMLQALNDPEFLKSPPKLLIWEFASYHSLNDRIFYRQALPLLNSSCEGKSLVLQDSIKLKPGTNTVLFNAGNSSGWNTAAFKNAPVADKEKVKELSAGRAKAWNNDDSSSLTIENKDHFMSLEFSDPEFRELDMQIWTLNGRRDKVKIEYSEFMKMNGRFAFNLKDDGDWADYIYLASEINIPDTYTDLSVTVRICKR